MLDSHSAIGGSSFGIKWPAEVDSFWRGADGVGALLGLQKNATIQQRTKRLNAHSGGGVVQVDDI